VRFSEIARLKARATRPRTTMIEYWLSGPVDGVHPLLMPAAHAFLQVREEIPQFLQGLSLDQIWARPGQSASIGFHAIHLAGATDRLLTYARGEQLTEAQLTDVRTTEKTVTGVTADVITARVNAAMDAALAQVRATPVESLATARHVGRKLLPSTTLGLIAHAAEHASRHAGQIATLRRIVADS
jgi:uncharacterized damage-inducible protein DinB